MEFSDHRCGNDFAFFLFFSKRNVNTEKQTEWPTNEQKGRKQRKRKLNVDRKSQPALDPNLEHRETNKQNEG